MDGWMGVSSSNNDFSHPLFTERSRPLRIHRPGPAPHIPLGHDRKMQNTPKDGHVFVGRHDTFLIRCCCSQNSMGNMEGGEEGGGGAVLFCLEAKRRRRRRRRRRKK